MHHALAEPDVAELLEGLDRVGPRLGPAHDLQEPHVARRVEEMRDAEIPLEALRHALDEVAERDGRGVGGDDRALLAVPLDLLVGRALHGQILEHHLDDPVALRQQIQVILKIAGRHLPGVARMHEGRGVRLQQALDRALRHLVPVCGALGHDVEQHHRETRVRDMRRDAPAHDPRAQHGHFAALRGGEAR